jgi:hypothetical protein
MPETTNENIEKSKDPDPGEAPKVGGSIADFTEALVQLGSSHLYLSAMMTKARRLLQGVRPLGKSGGQVAVLESDIRSLLSVYNHSLPLFKKDRFNPIANHVLKAMHEEQQKMNEESQQKKAEAKQ